MLTFFFIVLILCEKQHFARTLLPLGGGGTFLPEHCILAKSRICYRAGGGGCLEKENTTLLK